MKKAILVIMAALLIMAMPGCSVEYADNSGGATESTSCRHNYSTATCLEPSKCKKCGEIQGTLGEHSYTDGTCNLCGDEDPDYEPPVLSGSEYERINSLMEGMYQFRIDTGNLVEYHFEDGAFVCYTQLGSSILENSGTYILTEKTLILYYQNGTVKDCRWLLTDDGEIELFLLELTE